MISFKQFIIEVQKHSSADTSLKQISSGLKYAVSKGLIKPNSINVDSGGGRYDLGKQYVEDSVDGAKLHVHDPFNRSDKHNSEVESVTAGKSDYVGMHNVLNVIEEPDSRLTALKTAKSFMKPKTGIAHFTVYEGDRSSKGRISKSDKGRGSSWQEHRPTSTYVDEVKSVFPEDSHEIKHKGSHIIVSQK